MSQQQTYVCSGCSLMNAYPAGSQLVACARCKQVSNVAPQTATMNIPCTNCKTVLTFPATTKLANCPMCNAIFSIQTHVLPPGVQVMAGPNVHVQHAPPAPPPPAPVREEPTPLQPEATSKTEEEVEKQFGKRPTTASTRVAQTITSPKGDTIEGATTDWSDIWQAKPMAGDEHTALMQEFDEVTAQREQEWSKKKTR